MRKEPSIMKRIMNKEPYVAILILLCISFGLYSQEIIQKKLAVYECKSNSLITHINDKYQSLNAKICYVSIDSIPGVDSRIILVNYLFNDTILMPDLIYGRLGSKKAVIYLTGVVDERIISVSEDVCSYIPQATSDYPDALDDGVVEAFLLKGNHLYSINHLSGERKLIDYLK